MELEPLEMCVCVFPQTQFLDHGKPLDPPPVDRCFSLPAVVPSTVLKTVTARLNQKHVRTGFLAPPSEIDQHRKLRLPALPGLPGLPGACDDVE